MIRTVLLLIPLYFTAQLPTQAQDAASKGQKILEDSKFFSKDLLKAVRRMQQISITEGDVGLRVQTQQPTAPAIEEIVKKYGAPDKKYDDRLWGPPPR